MTNRLHPKSYFSRSHLSVFLIIFAVLGLIILIKSFAAPNPSLPGDLNNDSKVDIADLSLLLSDFGSTDPTKIAQADIIVNNQVDIFDLSALLNNFGKSVSGGGTTLGSKLPARLPQSTGSTYYVDGTSGSDSSNGSSATPWKTINHALSTVPLSGSIIRVRPGTYNSSGSSYVIQFTRKGDVNNPVTLMADTPGTVTIANSDPTTSTFGMWALNASGLRVQDMTFRILSNSGIGGFDGEVLVENSDRVELYRNTFNQVGVIGITCRGGHLGTGSTSDDMWVIDNTFRPSGTNPFAQVTGLSYLSNQYFGSKGSHWIYSGQWGADGTSLNWNQVNGCNRSVFTNNVFVGAAAGRDIELGPEERNSFVVNNTFYGNQSLLP